jgi:TonB-linked SusC/RagA family outer membrane protein
MRKTFTFLAALLLCSMLTIAQQRVVTGRVTDPQGQPVPFATIKIKGAKGGVSADAEGNFTIKVSSNQTIIVSGTGIAPKEVVVGESSNLSVQVSRANSSLDEVVVTALGVKRSRNSLPYAAQQISGDEVNKTVTTNLVNNLSGKVAGLQITASNAMGGASNVVLRGWRSLTQSNQALFIVDGVPYDNSTTTGSGYDFGNATQDLNPDDVASVSVLKGPAASALYGSRGSNGVIIISTKKPSTKRNLDVTASFGVGVGSPDKSTLPTYQTMYGEGYDATTNGFYYENVPWANGGTSPITIVATPDDAGTGPLYDPSLQVYNWDAFSPSNPNFHKSTAWQPAAHHNPTDYFVTPATTTESILTMGGNENGSFKFGYTRDDEKGYIPNSSIKKNLFDLGGTYNFNKRISMETGLNVANTDATNRYLYQYTAASNPMTDFRQWWPTNVNIKEQKADYFDCHCNATWNWPDGSYQTNVANNIARPSYHDNLYWFAYHNPEADSRNRYTGHVRGNIVITDFLSLSGTFSDDYYTSLIEQRADIGSQAPSYYSRQNSTFNEANYNLMLNFNKNLGTDFALHALLGGNIQRDNITSIYATTTGGLVVPGFWSISNSLNTPAAPIETDQRKEINSVFAQATLSWRNMLTLDASLRRDESSTLPAGNNSFYYPSVSANWVFSKLLQDVNWLSYGKVWANYAEVGGDAPYYSVYRSYTLNTPINGQAVISDQTQFPNANLVPEENKSYEVGLEMSFLNSRLGFNADYYHAVQSNEILPINLSQATGYNTASVNGGQVQNQGVEATVDITPVKTRNFVWQMKVNWSKNINKVLSLYGGQPSYAIANLQNGLQLVAEVGKPYGILRGTDYSYAANGQRLIDPNGYYEWNSNTLSDIGNVQPNWKGGIENNFTYKNWSFGFLIDIQQGGEVYSLDMDYGSYSGLYPRTAGLNDLHNPLRGPLSSGAGIILKGVLDDGKTPNTTRIEENVGDGSWTFGSGNGVGSETNKQFVYSATYVKLREAGLTYSIPARTLEGLHSIKGISLSLSGHNLWMIHKDLPYADPEQGQSSGNASVGFQNGAYPMVRTANFILKVNF